MKSLVYTTCFNLYIIFLLRTVIYDFSCSLSAYARKRNPRYNDVDFFIDSFHQRGHKCGTKFKLPREDPAFANLRTSIPEVYNRVLKTIRTSVRYMSQSSAFAYLEYFIMVRNEQTIERMLQAQYK